MNIEVEGENTHCLPRGQTLSVLLYVYLPTQKQENITKLRKSRLLDAGCHTNLPRFQGARSDRVRVESSFCCFSRELVSFDRLENG